MKLKTLVNKAVAELIVKFDHTYSDELLMAAYKAGEAKGLRTAAAVLRMAAMHREGATSAERRGESNVLHEFADKFRHNAQALEKP